MPLTWRARCQAAQAHLAARFRALKNMARPGAARAGGCSEARRRGAEAQRPTRRVIRCVAGARKERGVTEPVQWDPQVPPALRRVLQELVEDAHPDDGGPLGVLAELLEVPTPPESGYDASRCGSAARSSDLTRNASTALYKLSPRHGSPHLDRRVNEALASGRIDMEMSDGIFYRQEDAADELDVSDVVDKLIPPLHGRFPPAASGNRAGRLWLTASTNSPCSKESTHWKALCASHRRKQDLSRTEEAVPDGRAGSARCRYQPTAQLRQRDAGSSSRRGQDVGPHSRRGTRRLPGGRRVDEHAHRPGR